LTEAIAREILPETMLRAINVAARAHLHQNRKSENLPFITHPFAVGLILSRAGCSEEVIAAGILHDTVEDTSMTLEDIRREFGERIAALVGSASEPDRSLSWEERKTHTVETVKKAVLEVKMVVCADKLHNVKTIADAMKEIGEQVWSRFKRGKEQQEWYYRSLAESLSSETEHRGYQMLLAEYRKAVDDLFTSPCTAARL
jgi:(p)ppGpp synthase/HD superfamily hydrolase